MRWYEMQIAGMVGKTIHVDGRPRKVIYAVPVGTVDDDPAYGADIMRLELEDA